MSVNFFQTQKIHSQACFAYENRLILPAVEYIIQYIRLSRLPRTGMRIMRIYNSLTRRKEEFVPLEEGKVKMYACGITVSGEAHVGHGYQALIYDIMRKFLEKQGYAVTYARNYTDVDDKIIAKSKETGIPADKYAAMMIEKINGVMREMEIDDPTLWLKATENIDNIIDFIQRLIEKGNAYPAANGDVYFSVESFKKYGCLSNRSVEDMLNGVRVENDEEKRNPADFALWLGVPLGQGTARLAYRVFGDEQGGFRRPY